MDTLFSFRYMRIIVAVLGIMLIFTFTAYVAKILNLISYEPSYSTINVEGIAELNAVPDIGTFSFTVEAEAADVAEAQKLSGEKINTIMNYLKTDGGVEEKDIKTTGYNAYPRYEYKRENCSVGYCDNKRNLVGYVVTQNVRVKVRDTAKAGKLIGGVGSYGATNMSGLSFEVDDIESLREEARLLATRDAKEKAKRLAKELDARLGDIISFSDGSSGGYPVPVMARGFSKDVAFSEPVQEKIFAPDISVGEDTITARVTITYQIK